MAVLAIDTALGACAACVLDPMAAEPIARESIAMERGHAEALLPLVRRVIAAVPGGFSTIDRIVVTAGPGSYTGLRVGLSAARAFGLALNKPVVGVSTLHALAASHVAAGHRSLVAAAIDARHDRVYVQVVAADGRVMVPAAIMGLRDAVRAIGAGPVRMTGPGAPRLAVEAWTLGLDVLTIDAVPAPDIAWVARLGALAEPEESPPRPLYMAPPDAKPQDAARLARR